MTGRAPRSADGFTLIELIVSITIAGIIVGFIGMFMATPMQAYYAQTRRTDLTDSAEAITRALGQDIPTALPNSVRVTRNGSFVVVEFLATADSERYFRTGETGAASRELDFTGADGQFSTDGVFNAPVHPPTPVPFFLSVDNQGTPGADAYELANVITPSGTVITVTTAGGSEDQVTMSPAFHFAADSPNHRAYVVTQAVAYLCDEGAHTVSRYANYTIAADKTTRASPAAFIGAGAVSSLVARYPTACEFDYAAGTATRGGVLSIRATLLKDAETVQVFHQVAVRGLP